MKQNKTKVAKIVKKVVIILLIIIAFIAVVSIMWIGKMVNDGILYQNRENDTKNNSIKQLAIWGFDREAFHEKYEGTDFAIQSADGNTVPGTIYLSGENNPWAIIVHGAGGDREAGLGVAEIYLEKNYNVLTYDQRGHGDNTDERVTFGVFEAHDIEALVEYIKNDYRAETIVLHGQSMGGATAALYAASEHGEVNLDACILDSPVPGFELFMTLMFMEDDCSEEMAKSILWCGEVYSGLFSHLNYKDGDTIEKAKNIQIPTMVMVSEQDTICLPEYVMQVYENVSSDEKKVVEFDCEHIKGVFEYKDQYQQETFDFLDEVLK